MPRVAKKKKIIFSPDENLWSFLKRKKEEESKGGGGYMLDTQGDPELLVRRII